MKIILVFLSCYLFLSCKKNEQTSVEEIKKPSLTTDHRLSYLALGDSYTIGESVPQQQSFPYQLVKTINNAGLEVSAPRIIARTGWTTDELQIAVTGAKITQTFSLVTLLIGVNNQYRYYSKEVYRKEFKELLLSAIGFAGGIKEHVFVVSIPDWGSTTFGKTSGRDPQAVGLEIDEFNAINKEQTLMAGVSYTDITPDSKKAKNDVSLIASDDLHPSGKMYAGWASALAVPVLKVFKP